ncbi:N-6 DNA methylase [Treponema socranskii]
MTHLTELTELFERNKKQYNTSAYDEANTRTDFIDKFFELLGWDIRNEQGYSEQYREVVREDKVTIGGKVKAPDYAFRIGGVRKFFVEAKKPSVNIKDEVEPAFQVRRYGYTAKLPLCILTDFEEFAVYDTRIKPSPSDKPSAARIFYCTFDEYHKNFDFIFNTFSKEAILKGSFDTYIQENKNKKGTSEVDKELLKLIESWRTDIAKNIALRNPLLSIYHLNTAVQKIIDRIIFLRIAEDKEMEEYGLLKKITESGAVYQKLQGVFDKANVKYNSGLFKPHDWLRSLTIDDAVLSSIINGLYYPECPYEFSILPVEILGNIYEQFLGKTIKFRNVKGGHTALIEEKPEVKKAGGVYYTPQYIVRYIVENTLGVKIKGQSPDAVAKLKVVDPACGSGSFLVEAYQQLLNYHLDYYSNEKERKQALKNSRIYETGKNIYKLTIEEKQRILLNNIYGVDIDGQAVEVTKLSLYLKLLENEGSETQGQLFKFSDMKLLPSLDSNIKCGNSLVGSDYYTEKDLSLFDDEAMRKINTFDWDKEFPEVFAQGGFDCVIGNPPYFNIQTLGAKSEIVEYIQNKYAEIWQDKSDILFYFLYLAMKLSKDSIGFIVSNAFLFSDKARKLRNKILADNRLNRIINFEVFPVFKGVGITTCITLFDKNKKDFYAVSLKGKDYSEPEVTDYIRNKNNEYKVNIRADNVFALVDERIEKINKKIDGTYPQLKDICLVGKGMETAADEVFLFDAYPNELPTEFIKKRVTGKNMDRYIIYPDSVYVLYFENVALFKDLPEPIQLHLNKYKKQLSGRAQIKRSKSSSWWKYTFAMHKEYYHLPKLYCSRRASNNTFSYDTGFNYLGFSNMTLIFDTNPEYNLKYILTLLNSSTLNFRYKSIGKQTGGGSFEYFPNGVGKLPIPPANTEQQAIFCTLADQMLETQSKLQQAFSDEDKKLLEQRAAIIDKQIDKAVYQLYGLTEDEVKIVEGK